MTGAEIRERFLKYFEERGHRRVASSSLVLEGDPTLMFPNAGMVPFKRVFLGEETRDYSTATTSQKCMRVSGKHNDLEEVGRSKRHLTFFEMLGNFSFGDYFKKEAIEYAWDFLVNVLGMDPDDLVVSVLHDDDEAYSLWHDEIGLAENRIFRLGEKENFWQMGDTGPCGPCSEIHYITDRDAFEAGADPSQDGFHEIWNLVFMQYDQHEDGSRTPLPKPSVDTGMGLERVAMCMAGVEWAYEIDLLGPMMAEIQEISGVRYGTSEEQNVSLRVVADHSRSCSFLIGDGVLPSNEGRGYVLRRVLRRAARHGVLLGIEEPFLHRVAGTVVDTMGDAFPTLRERRAFIVETIRREEERFLRTLSRGLDLLEAEVREARQAGRSRLAGDVVFKLYDTYGFPTDLTEDILRGRDLDYDRDAFDACMQEQADRARAAWKGSGQTAPDEVYSAVVARGRSEFTGYDGLEQETRVVALLRGGEEVDSASEGEAVEVVVERTPFYGESGGQVGDTGSIEGPGGSVRVEDTLRPVDGLWVHRGQVSLGRIAVGDTVRACVDADQRAATVRNHSGTHLFHWALRQVLGPQVAQAGSLVGPDRLRFDFTHDLPLTSDEVRTIEDRVNALIFSDVPADVQEKSYDEAIASGAVAIFEEKYGDRVRVVNFGPSTELCGGTHARSTGEIGCFRILSQSAIGAGVRRVEAQTGFGVIESARRDHETLRETADILRSAPAELPDRVRKLLERQKELERELEKTRAEMRRGGSADPLQQAREVAGVKVIAARVEDANPKELRAMVDELKQRLGSGVVMLAASQGDKAALAMGVTADLTVRFKAGDLVKQVAGDVGGSGGGRPDFAQAGGSRPDGIDRALEHLVELVEAG
ncbi:MAG: alanine--tRNA ligase [Deltaproteobacteria bacterium]|nr:alanine--tRNA ligase [Deltaproteobacteria bacterium]